jgi:hypothetical protein
MRIPGLPSASTEQLSLHKHCLNLDADFDGCYCGGDGLVTGART